MNHQPNTPASLNEAVSLPTYGTLPWATVRAYVAAAAGSAPIIDPEYFIGHQTVGINFNSLNRIMSALAATAAAIDAREQEAPSDTASQDTALLDFMQRHRVAVIPEFEGPWDAEIYGEDEAPNARGSGNTPREAIDAARAALASQRGCAVEREALSPATVAQPVELRGVAETLENQDGCWRSCSGCHELNEGHDTGPYSAVLKCHLGSGCSECGGIGAIWDTTDYADMADHMAESIKTAAQPCASQGCGGAVEDCAVDVYSSRMCERGTKGCTASHVALSTAPRSLDGATPGGNNE